MKGKKVFYSELAYALGILALALGTALMERADLGMSMVVAPAYLLHLKLSRHWPAFTFGMSEYVFQAVLIAALSIVTRGFRKRYLASFATAVVYGFALDIAMRVVGAAPVDGVAWRAALYAGGMLLCAAGVALLFHTYIAPEAYELFVKEISNRYRFNIARVKTVYDCASCLTGILLSFAFFGFGRFEGVKAGTIVCALVNGWLIGRIGGWLEAAFNFEDALPLRDRFSR